MRFASWLVASVVVALVAVPSPVRAVELTGDQIVALVTGAARNMEKKYVGAFSKRDAKVTVSDPDDGDVTSTIEIEVDVWEYHGEHPTRKVRSCRIDGEDVALEKCEEKQRLEPPYRLFAEDSEKHYRFEYGGEGTWEGKPTYQIRIVPLEETQRHLKGTLHVGRDELRLAGFDVTLADYPFGLQSFALQMSFEQKDGSPILDHGKSDATIYVPLVINERRVTEFRASDQKQLTTRVAAK